MSLQMAISMRKLGLGGNQTEVEQKDKIAKGVFFTTCIYAVIAIACKWFL